MWATWLCLLQDAGEPPSMPDMSIRDQLLEEIDRFMRRTGMPKTKLALAAVRDPAWVTRLQNGELDPRIGTVEEIRAFMATYKPEGQKAPVRPRSRPRSSASSQSRRRRKA